MSGSNYPLVDIVILNWNGLEDTRECIRSVMADPYPGIRIRVVDNNSANQEAARLAAEFPTVDMLAQPENLGFCGGCNVGMRKALAENADYIMLLNNDALIGPGLVEQLIRQYRMLDKPGAISPAILYYPDTEKVWFSKATWRTDWKKGEIGFRLSEQEPYASIRDKAPYPSEFACGCCLFVATEVAREIGLFDERYFAFFDEAEWCARMKRKGYTSYVVPSLSMYHKVGGSTPSLVLVYLMTRNLLLWISDNLSFRGKLKAAPVLLKTLIWNGMNAWGLIPRRKQYASRESSRVAIRGWKDFIFRRFGKWNQRTAKVIFGKKTTE